MWRLSGPPCTSHAVVWGHIVLFSSIQRLATFFLRLKDRLKQHVNFLLLLILRRDGVTALTFMIYRVISRTALVCYDHDWLSLFGLFVHRSAWLRAAVSIVQI